MESDRLLKLILPLATSNVLGEILVLSKHGVNNLATFTKDFGVGKSGTEFQRLRNVHRPYC